MPLAAQRWCSVATRCASSGRERRDFNLKYYAQFGALDAIAEALVQKVRDEAV